ncbi:MAG: ribosome-binding factor A [Chloroflexi bacterium]|nr:ribosome-binding factor A [Chloroflexota bacterium]MBL01529.1 ribosome-binding factor A [Chloroflexota bacterium]|tara:strand:- start:9380 stop:9751 length:372 start_codon:yes stop_codon:yes gene_type:complete
MSKRIERINFTIRKELGTLLSENINDPRFSMMTSITNVDTSPDLSNAKIYVSIFGDENERMSSMEALYSASNRLRILLSKKIKIRKIPKLNFFLDNDLNYSSEMNDLIDNVIYQDNNKSTFSD